jgi:membrane protein implicated in regulation of membrane protease activity
MIIQAWQLWMIIGIICIVIEIFDPAFFFLSLGIAAIITGLLSFAIKSTPLQIIVFAVLSFIAFLSMRKLGKKLLTTPSSETNVYALKGKTGIVTKAIPEHGKGYVKVGGEGWSAIAQNNEEIPINTKVTVIEVEGNKLVVEKL